MKTSEAIYVTDQLDQKEQIDYNDLQPWSETIHENKYYFCYTPAPHVLTTIVDQAGLTPDFLSGEHIFWSDSISTTVFDKNYQQVFYKAYTETDKEIYNSSTQRRFFRFGMPSLERLASISGDGVTYNIDANGVLELTTLNKTLVYDQTRLRYIKIVRDSTGQEVHRTTRRYRLVKDIDPTYSGDPSDAVPEYIREERRITTTSGLCATEILTTTYTDYTIIENPCSHTRSQVEATEVSFSPNPVDEILNVSFESLAGPCQVTISSITGIPITKTSMQRSSAILVGHLTPGAYILKVESASGSTTVSKFIKQ